MVRREYEGRVGAMDEIGYAPDFELIIQWQLGLWRQHGSICMLYINNWLTRALRFYLGKQSEYTIYKAEGVGLLMGLHLLNGLSSQLTFSTSQGSDSQAAIRALGNHWAHSGQYQLNAIHLAAEHLHAKQDGLINKAEHQQLIDTGKGWKGCQRGIVGLHAPMRTQL